MLWLCAAVMSRYFIHERPREALELRLVFLISLFRCLGSAVLQCTVVELFSPGVSENLLLLSGSVLLVLSASVDKTRDVTGRQLGGDVGFFAMLLTGGLGGLFTLLGILCYTFPEFAASGGTLGGIQLLALAKTLHAAGTNAHGETESVIVALVGCSGIAWIVVGVVAPACCGISANSLVISGATTLVIGSAAFEVRPSLARVFSVAGAAVLCVGLVVRASLQSITRLFP